MESEIMSITVDIFMTLLRRAVTGSNEETDFADVDFEALFSLSNHHDLTHVLYRELNKMQVNWGEDTCRKFRRQYDMAVFHHVRSATAIERIREILGKAGIPFILLKGAVLMDLYPQPWMRTSSDVDVLIREEDIPQAVTTNLVTGCPWTLGRFTE